MAINSPNYKRSLLLVAIIVLAIGGFVSSGLFGLNWDFVSRILRIPVTSKIQSQIPEPQNVRVVSEESVVINVVNKVSPAVVTVGITQTASSNLGDLFQFDPFNQLSPLDLTPTPSPSQNAEQDIGSGFVVASDGLIVTNKHVVADTLGKYRIITKDNKTYDVTKIYRDPVNDLAILKINASGLPVVEMGDSSKIQVGQLAIAIGTALGEFRNTVTTGVVSGIGRGITAGSPLEGAAEKLDNVIQTSAAINPGNSGGPLLNSSGQVVGVNTAVSQEGQNIGFALPINVIRDAITNFNQTGQFNRPYLGVRYKTVTKDVAILNDVPEGAYIMDVIQGSPADKAGIQVQDIITNIDGTRLSGTNAELSSLISNKKVGDTLDITLDRDGKTITVKLVLGNQADQ
ncbi:MAG TPA: trypsin-like peptidase domain-containing protein [Patescibacteria group bacterium]|nr:trypsin-like peptidase domain-containing protein [Patescibacteria group bacterium]